jgi:hypothetical protein
LGIEFGRIETIGRPRDAARLESLAVKKDPGDEIDAAMEGRGDANFLGQLPVPDVTATGALEIER